jgi:small GTP-binding protein
MLMTIKD